MARIVWRVGDVMSIAVRDDLFCLAQMLESPYLVFFHTFRNTNQWNGIDLDREPILFVRGVARQFLKHARLEKRRDIAPRTNIEYPRRWLRSGPGSQKITVWPGTPDEMEVMTLGEEGVRVIEKDIRAGGFKREKVLTGYLEGPEHEELDLYEMDSLGVYPETTERLYLCHLLGKNVDPDKDLIAGRRLPREYKSYFEAMMGRAGAPGD